MAYLIFQISKVKNSFRLIPLISLQKGRCCSITLCVRNFHSHQLNYIVVFRNYSPLPINKDTVWEVCSLYYSIGNLHLSLLAVQLHFSVYIGNRWMSVYECNKVEGSELKFLDYLSFMQVPINMCYIRNLSQYGLFVCKHWKQVLVNEPE